MKPLRHAVRSLAPRILVAAALVMLAGCQGATPIKTLLDDPGKFDGKTVTIAGKVTTSVGIFGTGAYQVDDGTGKLTVVTKGGGTPREGAEVAVKGVFHSAFTLKTETAAVLLESERTTK